MPINAEAVTVGEFLSMMKELGDDVMDLPLRIQNDYGPIGIYSVRLIENSSKDVSEGTDGDVYEDNFIVING